MKTIWKYVLTPWCHIHMPAGGQILSIREQNGDVCMWVMVDTLAAMEIRRFEVVGTGSSLLDMPKCFRGTAMLEDGALVMHVFELL